MPRRALYGTSKTGSTRQADTRTTPTPPSSCPRLWRAPAALVATARRVRHRLMEADWKKETMRGRNPGVSRTWVRG